MNVSAVDNKVGWNRVMLLGKLQKEKRKTYTLTH